MDDKIDEMMTSIGSKLALAAIIVSAAAFLVTSLRIMLEHASSRSLRNNCSPGAIHVASALVKRSWSFRSWKWKLYYPQINFEAYAVLREVWNSEISGIETCPISALCDDKTKWGFRGIKSDDAITSSHICDGITVLVKNKLSYDGNSGFQFVPATTRDLPWGQWAKWRWWKLWNSPQAVRRPRATWAQILRAYGLKDVKTITTRLIDAESVPGNIDVAIQRIRLFDLGLHALSLGFTKVTINTAERDFVATGPFATITTENVPGFGKVLRFEGDMLTINHTTRRCAALWLYVGASHLMGRFVFGSFESWGVVLPLRLITTAISQDWTSRRLTAALKELLLHDEQSLAVGHLPREASIMKDLVDQALKDESSILFGRQRTEFATDIKLWKLEQKYGNVHQKLRELVNNKFKDYETPLRTAFSRWQTTTRTRVPTVLAVASFASIPSIANGYPSRVMLSPFTELFRTIASDLASRAYDTFLVSPELQHAVSDGSIPFLNEESRFIMGNGLGATSSGHYGWGMCPLRVVLEKLPLAVREQILPRSSEHSEPSDINGLIMPLSLELLQCFEPQKWSKLNHEKHSAFGFQSFRMENLVWSQVIMLDVAIRLLIRGAVERLDVVYPRSTEKQSRNTKNENTLLEAILLAKENFGWGVPETIILDCITRSWRPSETVHVETDTAPRTSHSTSSGHTVVQPEYQDWDLLTPLRDHSGLPKDSPDAELRLRKLADLIKLRALFHIAFLMLVPDSSDVYEANGSEVELPII